jgi:hypothetical protein
VHFGVLAPKINSGLMYAGAESGSGSLVGAAAAWEGFASELGSAAMSYQAVLSDLTRRTVGGYLVGVDGGCGRPVCGVEDHHRRSRADRQPTHIGDRLELEIALVELFRRVPTLELAVPFEERTFSSRSMVYGLHALPVGW